MVNGTKVTWLDNVSKLFTQYDVIQMRFHFDLSDYSTVKESAQAIALAVSAEHPNTTAQMPMNEAPWTDAQMATFSDWVSGGFWYSQTQQNPPAPPPPDPALADFIALSSALTGFDLTQDMDQLHPANEVASYYLGRIRGWSGGGNLDALIAAYKQDPGSLPQLFSGAQYGALCQQIVLLWYTSALVTVTGSGPTYDFGTPLDNQYPTGLMWQAAQAHPMGYSIEQFGYWANEPQGTASTGLGQSSGV
jgi:hypothetical protein